MATNLIFYFLILILLPGCSGDASQNEKKETISHLQMSSIVLKFIPESPSYVPSKPQQDSARAIMSRTYANNQIEFTTTSTIEFVDQSENFDSVSCNLCGKTFDVDFWQTAMGKAYEKQFEDLAFTTPCCYELTSLNDLGVLLSL